MKVFQVVGLASEAKNIRIVTVFAVTLKVYASSESQALKFALENDGLMPGKATVIKEQGEIPDMLVTAGARIVTRIKIWEGISSSSDNPFYKAKALYT